MQGCVLSGLVAPNYQRNTELSSTNNTSEGTRTPTPELQSHHNQRTTHHAGAALHSPAGAIPTRSLQHLILFTLYSTISFLLAHGLLSAIFISTAAEV
jgi:hypothetical protein